MSRIRLQVVIVPSIYEPSPLGGIMANSSTILNQSMLNSGESRSSNGASHTTSNSVNSSMAYAAHPLMSSSAIFNSIYRKFLLIADKDSTLRVICDQIVEKFFKLYPGDTLLEINRLQDGSNDLDLDPEYLVGDVFDANIKDNIIKVIINNDLRPIDQQTFPSFSTSLLNDVSADDSSMSKRKISENSTISSSDISMFKRLKISNTIWSRTAQKPSSPSLASGRPLLQNILSSSVNNTAANIIQQNGDVQSTPLQNNGKSVTLDIPRKRGHHPLSNDTANITLTPPSGRSGIIMSPNKSLRQLPDDHDDDDDDYEMVNVTTIIHSPSSKRITSGMLQIPTKSSNDDEYLKSKEDENVVDSQNENLKKDEFIVKKKEEEQRISKKEIMKMFKKGMRAPSNSSATHRNPTNKSKNKLASKPQSPPFARTTRLAAAISQKKTSAMISKGLKYTSTDDLHREVISMNSFSDSEKDDDENENENENKDVRKQLIPDDKSQNGNITNSSNLQETQLLENEQQNQITSLHELKSNEVEAKSKAVDAKQPRAKQNKKIEPNQAKSPKNIGLINDSSVSKESLLESINRTQENIKNLIGANSTLVQVPSNVVLHGNFHKGGDDISMTTDKNSLAVTIKMNQLASQNPMLDKTLSPRETKKLPISKKKTPTPTPTQVSSSSKTKKSGVKHSLPGTANKIIPSSTPSGMKIIDKVSRSTKTLAQAGQAQKVQAIGKAVKNDSVRAISKKASGTASSPSRIRKPSENALAKKGNSASIEKPSQTDADPDKNKDKSSIVSAIAEKASVAATASSGAKLSEKNCKESADTGVRLSDNNTVSSRTRRKSIIELSSSQESLDSKNNSTLTTESGINSNRDARITSSGAQDDDINNGSTEMKNPNNNSVINNMPNNDIEMKSTTDIEATTDSSSSNESSSDNEFSSDDSDNSSGSNSEPISQTQPSLSEHKPMNKKSIIASKRPVENSDHEMDIDSPESSPAISVPIPARSQTTRKNISSKKSTYESLIPNDSEVKSKKDSNKNPVGYSLKNRLTSLSSLQNKGIPGVKEFSKANVNKSKVESSDDSSDDDSSDDNHFTNGKTPVSKNAPVTGKKDIDNSDSDSDSNSDSDSDSNSDSDSDSDNNGKPNKKKTQSKRKTTFISSSSTSKYKASKRRRNEGFKSLFS